MHQPVHDDGVPSDLGVELREAAQLQQILRLFQRGAQPVAETDQAASGWIPAAREYLVEVYLAHARLLGQHGLGKAPFFKQTVQNLRHAFVAEMLLMVRKKFIQV